MIQQIKEKLTEWLNNLSKEINVQNAYLFGSSIYKDGIQFNPAKSDLDIIIVMPDEIVTSLEREKWLTILKKHKALLEQQMLILMKKDSAKEEIISIVPISNIELTYDVHKSSARDFFKSNDFYDIKACQIVKGGSVAQYITLNNELGIQVLESIQKKRNLYLKNTPTEDLNQLEWKGTDVLPKDFMRECAKVYSISSGVKDSGDQFNLSYGTDFLKAELLKLNKDHEDFAKLYNWMDARTGGRTNVKADMLDQNSYLLLNEILFDIMGIELKKMKIKQEEVDKQNEGFLNRLKINDDFSVFLKSSELLTKAHAKKENVLLDDIYIYPELLKNDSIRNYEISVDSERVIAEFGKKSKILIAGEDQSGKTSLCKKYYVSLLDKKLIPIYVSDKKNNFLGSIEAKLEKAYYEQYADPIKFEDLKKEFIIPIIDDFHFAKHKEKIIKDLKVYERKIIIVDDIFGLNIKDETLINGFIHFKIEELKPTLRDKLIRKWIQLNQSNVGDKPNENMLYQQIDKSTEFVNTSLGKIIGSGIMPAFPFFILSVISTYETFDKPLDQEITSQGHCYQALVYMYLRKQGVKNDEIDTYINFLTELANYYYKENVTELDQTKLDDFINSDYLPNYNLPVPIEVILGNLSRTNIFAQDSFNNYRFCYAYIYYFFVGKYLADHIETGKESSKKDSKASIVKIINNLHTNDNAYIAVFLSHHSKSAFVLDEIVKTAGGLFVKYAPCTLSETELSFFDEKVDIIIQAALPKPNHTPERARAKSLRQQDEIEKQNSQFNKQENTPALEMSEEDEEFAKEMRRSVKTVEVMGTMIKNRSGSLLKPDLERVFEEGMNVHLRIAAFFIDIIKEEKSQQEIVDFLSKILNRLIKEREQTSKSKNPINEERLLSMAKTLFWNTNFSVIFGFINKVVHSLGSDKLTQIVETVSAKTDTPASFLVKHGILMWYNKNLQIDNIADKIDSDGFSKTAKTIMNHMVVNHYQLHSIGFKETQKIRHRLKISQKSLNNKRRK